MQQSHDRPQHCEGLGGEVVDEVTKMVMTRLHASSVAGQNGICYMMSNR